MARNRVIRSGRLRRRRLALTDGPQLSGAPRMESATFPWLDGGLDHCASGVEPHRRERLECQRRPHQRFRIRMVGWGLDDAALPHLAHPALEKYEYTVRHRTYQR